VFIEMASCLPQNAALGRYPIRMSKSEMLIKRSLPFPECISHRPGKLIFGNKKTGIPRRRHAEWVIGLPADPLRSLHVAQQAPGGSVE